MYLISSMAKMQIDGQHGVSISHVAVLKQKFKDRLQLER